MRTPFLAAWMIALASACTVRDAVAVFHQVAHVVAVRHAADRAVVSRRQDRLVAHDDRADVLAVAGQRVAA